MKTLTNILEVFSRMRPIDLVDIGIVSFLVFLALRIIHRHIHKRVVIAIACLITIYVVARSYQLSLTLRFIEMIALSLGVGSVLIFQEDIRRFLESSLFSIFSPAPDDESGHWLQVILKSVATFSKNRVGALIVLQQRVPIFHVARGGHKLNGEVSFPLLCSLFDVHSIGHDGAVVIRGSRVTRFGVHLPLSRNYKATGRSGTRHSAALGLSEVTDAFVIVVSEETGEIGIAYQKEFKKVDISQLESALLGIRGAEENTGLVERIRQYLRNTTVPNLVSIALALLLWIVFVAPGAPQQRILFLPLTLEGVPKELLFDDPTPNEVKVVLSGPADAFANWPKEKQNIHVTIEQGVPGMQRVPLSPQNLSLPSDIKVTRLDPSYVTLKFHKSRRKLVPISLQVGNRNLASSSLKFSFQPTEIPLIIREGDPGPTNVVTEPIDISKYKPGDRFELKLVTPSKTSFLTDALPTVKVLVSASE